MYSICSTLPYTFMLKNIAQNKKRECFIDTTFGDENVDKYITAISYYSYTMTTTNILPLVATFVLYILALKELNSSSKVKSKVQKLRNKYLMKTFAMVTVVFFILTTPYNILLVIMAFMYKFNNTHFLSNFNMLDNVLTALKAILSINCCINPIMYCRIQRDMSKFARYTWQEHIRQEK